MLPVSSRPFLLKVYMDNHDLFVNINFSHLLSVVNCLCIYNCHSLLSHTSFFPIFFFVPFCFEWTSSQFCSASGTFNFYNCFLDSYGFPSSCLREFSYFKDLKPKYLSGTVLQRRIQYSMSVIFAIVNLEIRTLSILTRDKKEGKQLFCLLFFRRLLV